MKHLDLFSGIGGFALAARWMGWETVQFVEIDKFCQKVLNKNFPNVPIHGDIKTFDGSKYRSTVDILTGGFPCQPFSGAGNREGQNDPRYLWPRMLEVINDVRPPWIVGENVTGILTMENGRTLERIFIDLENSGYQVETFLIRACTVGLWQNRPRVWIIARSTQFDPKTLLYKNTVDALGNQTRVDVQGNGNIKTNFYYENYRTCPVPVLGNGVWSQIHDRGRDGIINGIPNRVDRIKGLGNAIAPQVAFEIFKAIDYLRYK